MFFEAAKTLANLVTEEDLAKVCLYPPLTRIREVSAHIAAAVVQVAYDRDLATEPKQDNLLEYVISKQYHPDYRNYV